MNYISFNEFKIIINYDNFLFSFELYEMSIYARAKAWVVWPYFT